MVFRFWLTDGMAGVVARVADGMAGVMARVTVGVDGVIIGGSGKI